MLQLNIKKSQDLDISFMLSNMIHIYVYLENEDIPDFLFII